MGKVYKFLSSFKPLWVAIAFAALCLFTRAYNVYHVVFPVGEEPALLGNDPYFHLREAETCFHNYPRIQKFDHSSHYPNLTRPPATGLYTLFLATVCKILSPSNAVSSEIISILAWMPPIFGALCCLMIYFIGAELRHPRTGLLGSLLYLLYPGLGLPRTALGFVDHHCMEIFLCLWILHGHIKFGNQIHTKPGWFPSWYPIPLALIFLCWSGAPMYGVLTATGLWVYLSFSDRSAKESVNTILQLAKFFGTVIVILGCIYLVFPDLWVMNRDREIERTLLSFGILFLGFPAYVFISDLLKEKISVNPKLISSFLFLACIALIAWYLMNTRQGGQIVRQLHDKSSGIIESMPVDFKRFLYIGSLPGLVSLIGFVYYPVRHFMRTPKDPAIIAAVFTMFLFYAWVNTYDLGYMMGISFAVMGSLVLSDAFDMIKSRLPKPKVSIQNKNLKKRKKHKEKLPPIYARSKFIAISGLALIVLAPILLKDSMHKFWMSKGYVNSSRLYSVPLVSSMDWLKHHSPALPLPTDSILQFEGRLRDFKHPPGSYGIITAWDYGNLVSQRGHRIPIWSRFGGGSQSKWMVSTDEEESMQHLCPECGEGEYIKYAVLDSRMAGPYFIAKNRLAGNDESALYKRETISSNGQSFQVTVFGAPYEESMLSRLYKYDGNNLSHYRLVWESREYAFVTYRAQGNQIILTDYEITTNEQLTNFYNIARLGYFSRNGLTLYKGYVSPKVKIFEIVPGAIVQGIVEPNTTAQISLKLKPNRSGREITFTRQSNSDAEGHVEFIFPYSNDFNPGRSDVVPDANCILLYSDGTGTHKEMGFRISEQDVMDSRVVYLGNLNP